MKNYQPKPKIVFKTNSMVLICIICQFETFRHNTKLISGNAKGKVYNGVNVKRGLKWSCNAASLLDITYNYSMQVFRIH